MGELNEAAEHRQIAELGAKVGVLEGKIAKMEITHAVQLRRNTWKTALVAGGVALMVGWAGSCSYNRVQYIDPVADKDTGKAGMKLHYDPSPFLTDSIRGKGPVLFPQAEGGIYTRDGKPLPAAPVESNYAPTRTPPPK